MKQKISLIDKIIEMFTQRNWYYNDDVKYEYDSYRLCQDGGDCCKGDYCRCKKISNAKVTEVYCDKIISDLTHDIKDQAIVYCIDRILRIFEIYNPDYWEVNVSQGYYGEEIDGIGLFQSKKNEIILAIEELKNYNSDAGKIKKCLEYEYGFILEDLINLKHFEINNVELASIKLNNTEYIKKISQSNFDFYQNYYLPRAICVKCKDYYRVIDGYNRILSAKKQKLETTSIIVLS